MKEILTTLITIIALTAFADIPRVDVMEVTYKGKTYFKWEYTAHLKFEEACVFDRQTGEYLYEQDDYFKRKKGYQEVNLYSDMIAIPKSKLSSKFKENDELDAYYSKNVISPVGKLLTLKISQLDSFEITRIIKGNMTGFTLPSNISKQDEDWILGYPLELIAKFNDQMTCYMEFYSIKGNVSQKESQTIIKKLESINNKYLMGTKDDNDAITLDQFYNQLLKRNILMIGFCSC